MVPHLSTSQRWLLVVALSVLVALSGCSGLSDEEPELPDGEEAVERLSDAGIYNVTQTVKTTVDNETTESRLEQTLRPATGERYQVTRQGGNRTITITNNTTTWIYRPAGTEVTQIAGGFEQQRQEAEQLRKLVDSLQTDDDPDGTFAPIAPLFGTSSTDGGSSVTETNITGERLRAQYRGVETVSGRDAHVIRLESVADADTDISQTLYYDAEYFVRLRMEYEIHTGERRVEGRMTTERIEFSPDVDDSLFTFDPPDNVTVRTTRLDRFDSYDDLERAADRAVPAPEMPAGFEFDSATLSEQSLSLQYSDGTSTVVVSRSSRDTRGVDGERIEHQGRTYRYSDQYRSNLIYWQCGEHWYQVSGQLERTELLAIGASIECPAPTDG